MRKSFELAEAEAKAPASVPTREAKADLVKTPSAEASIDCITSAALAATSESPFVGKHQPTDLPVGYLNHPRPTWAVIYVSKAHHGLSMLFHFAIPVIDFRESSVVNPLILAISSQLGFNDHRPRLNRALKRSLTFGRRTSGSQPRTTYLAFDCKINERFISIAYPWVFFPQTSQGRRRRPLCRR
ncbi:MAG: hypothetical protein ACTS6P_01505 [Candidatus Hodgkinia cicadicola]